MVRIVIDADMLALQRLVAAANGKFNTMMGLRLFSRRPARIVSFAAMARRQQCSTWRPSRYSLYERRRLAGRTPG
jgi:hypothetical protein